MHLSSLAECLAGEANVFGSLTKACRTFLGADILTEVMRRFNENPKHRKGARKAFEHTLLPGFPRNNRLTKLLDLAERKSLKPKYHFDDYDFACPENCGMKWSSFKKFKKSTQSKSVLQKTDTTGPARSGSINPRTAGPSGPAFADVFLNKTLRFWGILLFSEKTYYEFVSVVASGLITEGTVMKRLKLQPPMLPWKPDPVLCSQPPFFPTEPNPNLPPVKLPYNVLATSFF